MAAHLGVTSPSLNAQVTSSTVALSILASPKVTTQDLTTGIKGLKITESESSLSDALSEEFDESKDEEKQACLFVGDIGRFVQEDQLRDAFSKHGDVTQVEIKRDKVTRYNLGYGFVQFKTMEDASRAKEAMEGKELSGRKIRLGWARRNTTLFVGSLDGTVTTQQLRDAFSAFGPIALEETFVKSGSGKFGFVRFKNRGDAERAKSEMHHKMLGSRPIRIGWGGNNIQKHCVHVQLDFQANDSNITENTLHETFSQFGHVMNISLPRYPNGKLKGFGFIHYDESEDGEKAAAKAISTLSENSTASDVRLRCSYGRRKAKQSIPRPKGRSLTLPRETPEEPVYNHWGMPPPMWPVQVDQYGNHHAFYPQQPPESPHSGPQTSMYVPMQPPFFQMYPFGHSPPIEQPQVPYHVISPAMAPQAFSPHNHMIAPVLHLSAPMMPGPANPNALMPPVIYEQENISDSHNRVDSFPRMGTNDPFKVHGTLQRGEKSYLEPRVQ